MVEVLILVAAGITVSTAVAQVIHMAWKRGFDAGLEAARRNEEKDVMKKVLEELRRRGSWPPHDQQDAS
jgi:hypothetical protein